MVALDFKPDADRLTSWAADGVTDVLYGLPDKGEPEVRAYLERLAGKLRSMNSITETGEDN